MSTKIESSQRQIEWRRSKVAELDSQGHSQPEIARILQISIGTVNSIAQENESDEEITNKVF